MFIDKAEAIRRLKSPANLASAEFLRRPEVEIKQIDRGKVRNNLLEEQRDAIAKVAASGAYKQKDIAAVFGCDQRTVSTCLTGKVGSRPANEDRAAKRNERLDVAKDTALEKLMAALGLIDKDKLSGLDSAKELGKFSKDMASVFNSLQNEAGANRAPVNLIVYAPQSREEKQFKTIDV